MSTSSTPMQIEPSTVPERVIGEHGEDDADQREHEPEQCTDVLEQNDRQLRRLRGPDELDPRPATADLVGFVHGGPQREGLQPIATPSTTMAIQARSSGSGWVILW